MAVCFEITINRGTPIVAGIENVSVLSACVTYVSRQDELELRVGGLISAGRHDGEHLEWLEHDLKRGDEIMIRVIESSQPSLPGARRREDPEFAKNQERQYYERLKAQYEKE